MALRSASEFTVHMLCEVGAGRVDPRWFWIGAEGALSYAVAIASGDVAPDAVADERAAVCRACPHRTLNPDDPEALGFCGPAFVDRAGEEVPTCGCLLDGAVLVASKGCRLGRYAPVTRDGAAIGPACGLGGRDGSSEAGNPAAPGGL